MKNLIVILLVSVVIVCFSGVTSANGQTQTATTASIVSGTIVCNATTANFNSGNAAHPLKNRIDRSEYMEWIVNAPEGTLVEFLFVRKVVAGEQGKGESPFADKKRFFDAVIVSPGQRVGRGPVTAPDDKYSYEITCYVPGVATPKVIDPMIEIPKNP